MGANSTQALGLSVFLVAFLIISAALAMGGSLLLILLGIVLMGVSFGILLKAKPLEHIEN